MSRGPCHCGSGSSSGMCLGADNLPVNEYCDGSGSRSEPQAAAAPTLAIIPASELREAQADDVWPNTRGVMLLSDLLQDLRANGCQTLIEARLLAECERLLGAAAPRRASRAEEPTRDQVLVMNCARALRNGVTKPEWADSLLAYVGRLEAEVARFTERDAAMPDDPPYAMVCGQTCGCGKSTPMTKSVAWLCPEKCAHCGKPFVGMTIAAGSTFTVRFP